MKSWLVDMWKRVTPWYDRADADEREKRAQKHADEVRRAAKRATEVIASYERADAAFRRG